MSIDMMGNRVEDERPLKKNFLKKKLRKNFGGSKIVLTFASAFAKKALKKSSLKDLDINKQVVQDLSNDSLLNDK